MNNYLNPLILVFSNLFSGLLVAIVVYFLSRKKSKAETDFYSTSAYSTMLKDLKIQLDLQAQQIVNLQAKETYYLQVIAGYQTRESELMMRVAQLETKISSSPIANPL